MLPIRRRREDDRSIAVKLLFNNAVDGLPQCVQPVHLSSGCFCRIVTLSAASFVLVGELIPRAATLVRAALRTPSPVSRWRSRAGPLELKDFLGRVTVDQSFRDQPITVRARARRPDQRGELRPGRVRRGIGQGRGGQQPVDGIERARSRAPTLCVICRSW